LNDFVLLAAIRLTAGITDWVKISSKEIYQSRFGHHVASKLLFLPEILLLLGFLALGHADGA